MRVLIMGGTSGIGWATAERLAGAGAEVIVTGRDPDKVAAVDPRTATAVQLDATKTAAVASHLDELGEIDHLVLAFSPGAVGAGPLASVTADQLREAFEGKVFAYLEAIQRATVTGSITMISAASARAGMSGTSVLAAVNGAVDRLVSPLAAELAPVRVNAVSPGVVDTGWWSFLDEGARDEQFSGVAATLPVGRVAHPDDVAKAIAYLVDNDYVTGSVMAVDGGFTVA